MKLSLNIPVILSIVIGTVLVGNSGSAIAKTPEKSQAPTPILSNEQLESGETDFLFPEIIVDSEETEAANSDEDFYCSEDDTSPRCTY